MVFKVTVYGWAIPEDRFAGPGSGTFVDLVYFVDDEISIGDILNVINENGFKFMPLRYPRGHPLHGQVVTDKVNIDVLTLGAEPVYPPGPAGYSPEEARYMSDIQRLYEGGIE